MSRSERYSAIKRYLKWERYKTHEPEVTTHDVGDSPTSERTSLPRPKGLFGEIAVDIADKITYIFPFVFVGFGVVANCWIDGKEVKSSAFGRGLLEATKYVLISIPSSC